MNNKNLIYSEMFSKSESAYTLKFLCFFSVYHEMEKKLYDSYRVTIRQIEMLEVLFHFKNTQLTPTQIASFINLSKSSITTCIDSLENKGYVVRNFHMEDRRKVVLSLTQKGNIFCDQKLPVIYGHIEEA